MKRAKPQSRAAVTVRPARLRDCDEMARLSGQLGYPATRAEIASRIKALARSRDHGVFVAALPSGRVTGWIGVCVFHTIEAGSWAEISGLVVDDAFRSRRIGRVLLSHVEGWGKKRRCDVIAVHCNVVRERAHRFYEANGFGCVKTQKFLCKAL